MRFGNRRAVEKTDRSREQYRSRWPKERRHGRKLRSNRLTVSRRVKRKHRRAGR